MTSKHRGIDPKNEKKEDFGVGLLVETHQAHQ